MNASELAIKMLQWEEQKRKLDELESEIAATVLELGKTQTVGNARATYSQGRKTYDYERAAVGIPLDELDQLEEKHSRRVINYKAICEDAGVTEIPFEQGEPSVRLKLL